MTGKTLAHYEILEPLGAGGMGEVYRARDTKLDREVAIKVLPEDVAADVERLARFEREAKLLAQLNHANIAAIYGLEDSDGVRFIAMELVEGETLADRIARAGRIEVDEALAIARQVAEALEAAHDNGIIHRDLKPANVVVTADGKAKVLDFGLAKASAVERGSSGSGDSLTHSPTATIGATEAGVLLGTAPYMSPEQAKGGALDRRTDIWSFGCVVYEMLTGTRPFEGDNVTETLASVLKEEPDWDSLPDATPSPIAAMVRRCLRKDPARRLRDAGDARIEIEDVAAGMPTIGAGASGEAVDLRRSSVPHPVVAAAIAVVALAAGALGGWWIMDARGPDPTEVRFQFNLPEGADSGPRNYRTIAVSPDGSTIAFVAGNELWVRRLDVLEPDLLPGAGRVPRTLFFSPDGREIGYWAFGDREIRRLAISGGAPATVASAREPIFGATWSDDGMIYYATGAGGIWRVPALGDVEPDQVIVLQDGQSAYGPQLLPDGERILFTLRSGDTPWNDASIVVQSLGSGDRQVVVPGGTDGRWLASGHVVYHRDGDLFAIRWEPDDPEAGAQPVPVQSGVAASFNDTTGAAHYDVSDSGTLVFVPGEPLVPESFVTVDRTGGNLEVAGSAERPGRVWLPRLSPDGDMVAYILEEGSVTRSIWVLDLERGTTVQLTAGVDPTSLCWSPDGEWVYYGAGRGTRILRRRVDLAGDAEPVWQSEAFLGVRTISADGRWLLYTSVPHGAGNAAMDVWALDLEGNEARPVFDDPAVGELSAYLSPDGEKIAYLTDQNGYRIYVQPFPDGGSTELVSGVGAREPRWSPTDDRLYYRSGLSLMAVDFDAAGNPDPPRVVIESVARPDGQLAGSYDITRDGERFLFREVEVRRARQADNRINVVLDWFRELERRVPAAR